jgi:hypothetical protein
LPPRGPASAVTKATSKNRRISASGIAKGGREEGAYFPILIKRLGADWPAWDRSRTVRWQGLPSNPVDPSQPLED